MRKLLKYNMKTLIGFEFIYKLVSVFVFTPIFLLLFNLITKLSGYTYLTFENVISFLSKPITILFLLILIILVTFYTLIDLSTVIIILDSSYQEKKIKIKDAFILACKKSLCVFKIKNILLPFLVIFLIPFLNIGLSTGFISTISIPEFILDFINSNTLLLVLYSILIIILTVILFRWLYVIHYFVLEDCNFKEARKRSVNLSKKNKIKDFISIIITQTFIFIAYILFILIGIIFISLIYKCIGKVNIFSTLSITLIWILIAISFIIITLMSTPINYAIVTLRYYKNKDKIKENIVHVKVNNKEIKKQKKKFKVFKYVIIALVIFSGTLLTYLVMNNKYDLKIEYVKTMEVTAHRGASKEYPENTMSAFKGAKELGADFIELDIQQTKDKKLIVMHDTNLKRTTGVDKNIWETDYDEIKLLDAGSFLSDKFKGEKVPLFEDVVKWAKENNMKLNIELKPTGNETDFEKYVSDIIKKYDFYDECVITSQVYEVLENIKKCDKNIKTVYVMSLAYGDINKLTAADNFSIEASSVTRTLVNRVHKEGKELYAWTVNTKDSISDMVDLNVDNIITDNITLAKEVIYSSKTSNLIEEYIKFVNGLLN